VLYLLNKCLCFVIFSNKIPLLLYRFHTKVYTAGILMLVRIWVCQMT